MTTITLKLNEPIDVALRRFRRDIEKTGLIRELRSRTSYEKPTTERKRKKPAPLPGNTCVRSACCRPGKCTRRASCTTCRPRRLRFFR
jgi:small subunit ribosomal protein S21